MILYHGLSEVDDAFAAIQVLGNDDEYAYHVLWLLIFLTLKVSEVRWIPRGWTCCLEIWGHLKTLTFILIKLSDWLWQCLILVPLSYWRFCSLEVWFSLTATGYTGGSDDRFIATKVLANDYNHVYHVLWLVFLLTLKVCGGSLDSEGWIRCLRIRGHLIGHNFKFDWIMRLLMDNFKNTYCP